MTTKDYIKSCLSKATDRRNVCFNQEAFNFLQNAAYFLWENGKKEGGEREEESNWFTALELISRNSAASLLQDPILRYDPGNEFKNKKINSSYVLGTSLLNSILTCWDVI